MCVPEEKVKAAGKKLKAKVKLNKSALATQLAENFNYICNCNAINFQHTHTHIHTDTHTHTRKFAQKYATNMEGRARGGGAWLETPLPTPTQRATTTEICGKIF